MNRERITYHLHRYRETRARAACLREEIALLKRRAERVQSPEALIALNALPGRSIAGGGSGGLPGDPAAKLACSAADGCAQLNPYEDALRDAQDEYLLAVHDCRIVEAWLDALPARERWVVERHALEKLPFADLPDLYEAQHGRAYCLDTIKTLYRRALESIGRMTA